MRNDKEHLKVVIVGHVDHGKSTILGRLLADTGSLPEGKLEQVKESCRRTARPFEYAFLLDALKSEQSQGITIDAARCFFNTEKRDYIMIDAPGHIEFLKNMVTGAARAEAALLVIDALEGIQENSKRHGYMLSMLGVKQVAVLINKFDLVDYNPEVFEQIVKEYTEFLHNINVEATNFIPVSGREGVNIATRDEGLEWYSGPTVLEQLDLFKRPTESFNLPFRMPVQDIYKFTEESDDRRIVAGTIETGTIKVGDEVVFAPSGKESTVVSIEGFNVPEQGEIAAPYATGFTLGTQIYIRSGEIMCRKDQVQPRIGHRLKVNIFWLGRSPMIKGKRYKLKLATTRVAVELVEITSVIDASELSSVSGKQQLDRHDIGECVLETAKPIAFDQVSEIPGTGRFVLVDNYEIAGGGVVIERLEDNQSVLEEHIQQREFSWDAGLIAARDRAARNHHQGKFVVFTGEHGVGKHDLAKRVEYDLFNMRLNAYYLGVEIVFEGLDADLRSEMMGRDEHVRRLGELARIMTDAGLIFITAIDDLDDYELERLKLLNSPNEILVINVGRNNFSKFPVDLDMAEDFDLNDATTQVFKILNRHKVIPEYCI